MKAPTRALVVESDKRWASILGGAARRAGVSEVVVCSNLQMVKDALRSARFAIAILEIGLDPEDDLNSDGAKALEALRETDGASTKCVLVTGWQGGDRMELQADMQQKFGVDWAYMKERYEAPKIIAKLTELLEQAVEPRLHWTSGMAHLSASTARSALESQLLDALSPSGGIQILYTLTSRLLASAVPLIAMNPSVPLEETSDGVWIGLYWSRALATAVAVGLGPPVLWQDSEGYVSGYLERMLQAGVVPDLIESVRERNVQGRLWEIPGLVRDKFLG